MGTGCHMRDEVEFALPGGPLIHNLGKRFVLMHLKEMFSYRHEQLLQHFGQLPKVGMKKENLIQFPDVDPNNPILHYVNGL